MNKTRTYCFLINCSSNSSRAESIFRNREKNLRSKLSGKSEFIYISKEDSILDIAKEKSGQFSHIIACGGDGTVNRVANGIIGTSAVMGVIPLGSGNDFAQSIGLKLNFDEDFEILLQNNVTYVDGVKTEWGYFFNTYGIGVDGLTNYYASKSPFKNGGLKYFWAGLRSLSISKPFLAEIKMADTGIKISKKVWMIAIANGKTEGGKYTISPNSVNHDGELELVLVNDISRVRLLTEFIKLSFGYSFKENVVEILKPQVGFEIAIEHPVKAHADGEQVGSGADKFGFTFHKSAIPVVVNREKLPKNASYNLHG